MAKRRRKPPKRVKVARKEGQHHVYKDSGTKAPASAMWQQHFFQTHGLVCEQDDEGRFHCPDREVEMVKKKTRKRGAKKDEPKETEV